MSENRSRSRARRSAQWETAQPTVAQPDYTPDEQPFAPMQGEDLSYYYRRGSDDMAADTQPAFAPAPKLDLYAYAPEWQPQQPMDDPNAAQGNVYRRRAIDWGDSVSADDMPAQHTGYQVQAETTRKKHKKRKKRRKGHGLRVLAVFLCILAVLGIAAYLLREPIAAAFLQLKESVVPTQEPFEAVVTPEPVRGYDASPALVMAHGTQAAISRISGSLPLVTDAVTDFNVLTRNERADGLHDFYLFTAKEGRLLCYFEGLGRRDMYPLQDGGFYVKQSPWLVTSGGAPMVRIADYEATLGEALQLEPLYRGWAVVRGSQSGSANYIDRNSQLISTLWFSRTFPFTGEHTLAYVDTGATADAQQRYLLYVLGADGSMTRWLAADDMRDVVVCVNGMAYMQSGVVYHLPDVAAPLCATPRADLYVDCDALVVQDAGSGKYGLYVHGEQHYDFVYDSIHPVQSDIVWNEQIFAGEGGSFAVHAVADAAYPQPLSYYFVLERDGRSEYVALSADSACPFVLDGQL